MNFTVVCRSNYPEVNSCGFKINSDLFGPGQFHPQTVIRDPSELPVQGVEYDLILVCTKSTGKADIPASLVTPHKTGIVLFQNGINIEEPYAARFPDNPVVSAVLYVSCLQPTPGEIMHVGHIDIVKLGLYPAPSSPDAPAHPALGMITALLQAGGCNASATPYIQSDRWLKTVWNGCWNVLCALAGLDTHAVLASSPGAREMARTVTREIVLVARAALGVGTGVGAEVEALWGDEERTVERNVRMAEMAVPITPSMLQDARKGVEMEVEAFCGEVVRTGERLGVEMPVLKTLYPVLLAINYRFRMEREKGRL